MPRLELHVAVLAAFTCLLTGACSNHQASGSLSSDSSTTTTADRTFGDKLCNEVVDPLQQGSMHWMACLSEIDALLARPISQLDLVERVCEAIQDSFVHASSLAACKSGGRALIRGESFATAATDMFARTANSLVACHEQVSILQPSYDEEGRCSDDSDLSAWTLSARGRTTVRLESFESYSSRDPSVGAYRGSVSFHDATGRTCSFGLDFVYSGEDITVQTRDFRCR
jgi:hypothetical protein